MSEPAGTLERFVDHFTRGFTPQLAKHFAELPTPDPEFQARLDELAAKVHREFCQLFGPEKILENLEGFLGNFMIDKVMAGEDIKRASGTEPRSSRSGLPRAATFRRKLPTTGERQHRGRPRPPAE